MILAVFFLLISQNPRRPAQRSEDNRQPSQYGSPAVSVFQTVSRILRAYVTRWQRVSKQVTWKDIDIAFERTASLPHLMTSRSRWPAFPLDQHHFQLPYLPSLTFHQTPHYLPPTLSFPSIQTNHSFITSLYPPVYATTFYAPNDSQPNSAPQNPEYPPIHLSKPPQSIHRPKHPQDSAGKERLG